MARKSAKMEPMAPQAEGSEVVESVEVVNSVTTFKEVEMNAITESVVEESAITEEVEMKNIENSQAEGSESVIELIENSFTPDLQESEEDNGLETLDEDVGLDALDIPEEVETIDYRPMMRTTFVMTPEEELSQDAWDDIQERLDVLNVESIKLVIDYCKDRLHELQRADIEVLESQMREIQAKLFSIKSGSVLMPKITTSAIPSAKRTAKAIINPSNQMEVYTFGRHPDWLKELMETTGKTIDQLRNGN